MKLYTYSKIYLKYYTGIIEIVQIEFTKGDMLSKELYKGKSGDIPTSMADLEVISQESLENGLKLKVMSQYKYAMLKSNLF